MRPRNADFGITIDFDRGTSDPVRIFSAMTELLSAFKNVDRVILDAVDSDIESVMVLEDVEANTITSWVRNKIDKIDDQALKEFDVKQQVGKYAVKAKYKIIEYLDKKEDENEAEKLESLKEQLEQLRDEGWVPKTSIPRSIDMGKLVEPMEQIQDAKKYLGPNDRVIIKSEDQEHELNKQVTKRPSDYLPQESVPIKDGTMDMVLLVRKPDLIGNAKWEFKHGKNTLTAHIEDDAWLERFRSGEEIIIPGCAISCSVRYDYKYAKSGRLINAEHDIIKVYEIIKPDPGEQPDFLND